MVVFKIKPILNHPSFGENRTVQEIRYAPPLLEKSGIWNFKVYDPSAIIRKKIYAN